MKRINKVSSIASIVCVIIGVLFGLFLPEFAKAIEFIGKTYIQILKMLIGPVIFSSITISVLNRNKNKSFLVGKAILLFIIMFVATFLLTSLVVIILKPGCNFLSSEVKELSNKADFGLLSIIKNLFPTSLKALVLGGNTFFIILIALISAFLISFTKFKQTYSNAVTRAKKLLDKLLDLIILTTPVAVLSLVSNMVLAYDKNTLTMGLKYILIAYGCSVLAIILIMIIPTWIICKINPIKYIKKVSKVWLMSVSSCSSLATLPYTIKVCNKEFNVNEKITDIVVPLGCTIHMCGGAVSFALLGFFVCQMNGINVTFMMFLMMLLSSTLINMAAPGIPGGGVIIGMTYLSLLKLPFEGFYGLYVGIYKLLDMSYTTLNVTGDISANLILDKLEKRKTKNEIR